MDKREMLDRLAANGDERLLLGRVWDKYEQCRRRILPEGTGFLTDVGMTGPIHSVLGVRPEQSIAKMHGKLPVRFSTAEGPCRMNAVLLTLDDATGKTAAIERLNVD